MTAPQDPFAAPDPSSALPEPPQTGMAASPSSPQWSTTTGASSDAFAAPAYGTPPTGYGAAAGSGPRFASWGQRVGAFLIDMLLAVAGFIAGAVLGAVASGAEAAMALGYLGYFAVLVWQLVVQGRTGQTIGKKQLGIRLARWQDGQDVGAGLSIGRAVLHVVDAIPLYLGYLWPLWDSKKQTFADKIVSTVVVRV